MLRCLHNNNIKHKRDLLFNEWYSTLLQVSIPKESSGSSYKTFKPYQFFMFLHYTLVKSQLILNYYKFFVTL